MIRPAEPAAAARTIDRGVTPPDGDPHDTTLDPEDWSEVRRLGHELLDDLIGIGLDCFNPFQPEVMDVRALHEQYRGRLAFWGGLSIQRTLPYGSVEDVRREAADLIAMGTHGRTGLAHLFLGSTESMSGYQDLFEMRNLHGGLAYRRRS